MKLNTKQIATLLVLIFVGSLAITACSSSKPGFNKSGRAKGTKVKSSGKMY